MKKSVVMLLVATAFLLGGAIGWFGRIGYHAGAIREPQHLACHDASVRIAAFIERSGRWPSSWAELEDKTQDVPARDTSFVREHAAITFDVDLRDVAKCSPDRFYYISPIECARFQEALDGDVRVVIAAAQDALQRADAKN
jgi:hypothetical protein